MLNNTAGNKADKEFNFIHPEHAVIFLYIIIRTEIKNLPMSNERKG